MAKSSTVFKCQQCATEFAKWQGQCAGCGDWNTLVEEVKVVSKAQHPRQQGYAGSESTLISLKDVPLTDNARVTTGFAEFDHVLGGGLVSDSVTLIGGDPGIGKSTLLLQVIAKLNQIMPALYVSGEESLQQIAMRARRLALPVDHLQLLAETQVEKIIAQLDKLKPKVAVIDSIQTIFTDCVSSAPGSVSQLRESTSFLVQYAKRQGIALFLIGHVTKEGALAGPRVLEHVVDTVLYFEGKQEQRYRMIRAVKNRFGAVNELGIFAMTEEGLKQVSNPSAIFLSKDNKETPGSVVVPIWEGSRPLLVEVQALVDQSYLPNPKRVCVGLDPQRLPMLLAVLNKQVGIASYDQDVFANVVGGIKINETSGDLPLLLAILSSLKNKPLPKGLCVFGEVGLSGEIRPVASGVERLKEAERHGFSAAIVPNGNKPKHTTMQVYPVKTLAEACEILQGDLVGVW